MKLVLARRSAEVWKSCVEVVRERYAASFGADVAPNPDAFVVGYSDPAPLESSNISACAGLTFGSQRPFFSERYLDETIEVGISRHFGTMPDRNRIVEIGPLASRENGSGKEIILLTPVITWCLGMQYILCTATSPLTRMFEALKIPFSGIRHASKDRLAASERERWGTYYDSQPLVGVIPLNGIGALFADTTGRYSFADPEITLLDRVPSRRVGLSIGG